MTRYKIFQCPQCQTYLYTSKTQKTKKCPKCAKLIRLHRVKILQVTSNLRDTIYFVQNLKVPPAIRPHIHQLSKIQSKTKYKSQSKIDKFFELIHKLQENSKIDSLDETSFFQATTLAGFSEFWVVKTLEELARQGRLFYPQKGRLKFIL
ncbi:MAG: DUF1922 domain-containing protein [Candidatus Helarchaeota archaeon]